jgi:hypothetical protein
MASAIAAANNATIAPRSLNRLDFTVSPEHFGMRDRFRSPIAGMAEWPLGLGKSGV